MNEKIIIESKSTYPQKIMIIILVILGIAVACLIGSFISKATYAKYDRLIDEHFEAFDNADKTKWKVDDFKKSSAEFDELDASRNSAASAAGTLQQIAELFGILSIPFIICYFYAKKMSLTVTNKRVYGKAAFGKQVDLPLDSVSAIGMSAFQGIAIGTSSGKIKFVGISNRDEIHKAISNLLVERQEKKTVEQKPATVIQQSDADELGKYKKLLDNGVITQEEFDAKKKQILGL